MSFVLMDVFLSIIELRITVAVRSSVSLRICIQYSHHNGLMLKRGSQIIQIYLIDLRHVQNCMAYINTHLNNQSVAYTLWILTHYREYCFCKQKCARKSYINQKSAVEALSAQYVDLRLQIQLMHSLNLYCLRPFFADWALEQLQAFSLFHRQIMFDKRLALFLV